MPEVNRISASSSRHERHDGGLRGNRLYGPPRHRRSRSRGRTASAPSDRPTANKRAGGAAASASVSISKGVSPDRWPTTRRGSKGDDVDEELGYRRREKDGSPGRGRFAREAGAEPDLSAPLRSPVGRHRLAQRSGRRSANIQASANRAGRRTLRLDRPFAHPVLPSPKARRALPEAI